MTVKIAFASNDRRLVNQHFGAAESFAIYEMGENGYAPGGSGRIHRDRDGRTRRQAGRQDRSAGRLCGGVLQCGGASAIQQLLAKGIQPMRVDEGTLIEELLGGLQKNHGQRTAGMAGEAFQNRQTSANRFADEEEWQE